MSKKISVTLFDSNKENSNGRCYNMESMKKAFEEFAEKNKESGMLGELCHPSEQNLYVNPGNVSHRVENFDFENGKVNCDIEILDTPNGKIVQDIINAGMNPKFEPRMVGTPVYEVDENGNKTNKIIGYKDYKIISIDIIN